MKRSILVGCIVLGLVGCATQRGGVGSSSETAYGTDWGTGDPSLYTHQSIYPVRRQPSINGNDMGGVRPSIDPSRMYDMGYWAAEPRPSPGEIQPRVEIQPSVERENFDRAVAPRDPFVR